MRLLKEIASGRHPEIPGGIRKAARYIPRRALEEIRNEDPAIIDDVMTNCGRLMLGVRSDDAPPIAITMYDDDGRVVQIEVFGDIEKMPRAEVAKVAESPGA